MRRCRIIFNIEPMENHITKDAGTGENIGKRAGLLAPASAAVVFFIYLAFLSSRYNFDGTVFSLWLGQAVHGNNFGNLFHPHHMLYLPLAFVFTKVLSLLGVEAGMAVTLQFMDVIIAAVTLIVFFLFCFRHTANRFVSTVATMLLAFSFSFWYLAIEPEVYILHTLAVLVSVSLLFRYTAFIRSGVPSSGWICKSVVLGICGASCVLTHITGGLFLLPLFLGSLLYLGKNPSGGLSDRIRSGLPPALLMALVSLVLVSLVYWIAYEMTPRAAQQGFPDWLIGLASPDTGLGYEKSYWNFSPDMVKLWISGMQKNLVDGRGLSLNNPGWLAYLRAPVVFLYVTGLLIYLVRLPRLWRKQKGLHLLLLSAIIPLAFFSMVWEPQNFELKTALHPLLWFAMALGIDSLASTLKYGKTTYFIYGLLILLVVLLFSHNFYSTILPSSKEKNNPDLLKAYHIRDHTEKEAVIYMAGISGGYRMGKIYVLYFAGRRTRVVDWIIGRGERPFPENLLTSLYNDRDRPVYVLEELIKEGPALSKLGNNHRIGPEKIKDVFRALSPQPVSRYDNSFALYRIPQEELRNIGLTVPAH